MSVVTGCPYKARMQDSFALPPFSPPASHMTKERRVFVAIMEGKLAVRVRVGLRLGLSVWSLITII